MSTLQESLLKQKTVNVTKNTLYLLLEQLRPKQWIKNLLVFASILFAFKSVSIVIIVESIIAFIIFCMISSVVYIINDYVDREADSNHPEKRYRPMASGALNPKLALTTAVLFFVLSVAGAYTLNYQFGGIIIVYFISNLLYTFKLKHIVIIDLMMIACGFVLRSIGGGLAVTLELTPWFLLCTLLLALFMAISKRRHELNLYNENIQGHRKVLEHYSIALLDQMISVVTTATIISYSLFTFTSGHSVHLMWTIPIVIYGVFRNLYLIYVKGKGGKPERDLLEDKHIIFSVLVYSIVTISILILFE
jgi:4-hydroxybenzoate polyprenyltransferase